MEDAVVYRREQDDNVLIQIGRMHQKVKIRLSRQEMQSFTNMALIWLQSTPWVRGNIYQRAQYMTFLEVYEKKLRSSAVAVNNDLKVSLTLMQAYVTLIITLIIHESLAEFAVYEHNITNQIIRQLDEQTK